jgi:starch-binding outer membrane protein, SusD/RagB family
MAGDRMMMRKTKGRTIALLLAGLAASGCNDFLEVTSSGVLESDAIDPGSDAPVFSRSALQNFAVALGNMNLYGAWYTNEARVGDTFPTRNEYGRRDVQSSNGTHSGVWNTLQTAVASSENTIKEFDAEGLDLARVQFSAGYSVLFMAEAFCEGTVSISSTETGPPMTRAQMLDHSIMRFTEANTTAAALGTADGTAIATAALVGKARAQLLAGRKSEAAATAAQVPAAFSYSVVYIDDASNRGRLGNNLYAFTVSRLSLVVPPEYRAMADAGDTRIAYNDAGRVAQDGVLRFYRQRKFLSYADPIRLASGLEARYIKAEAEGNIDDMLTLINERRAVGEQSTFTSTDADAVLTELMAQKSRDFWLEGHRMGDFQRNPNNVPGIIPPGDTYYKPELGVVTGQTCWPVPDTERRNNPKWPQT